jgi:polysaccharide export outer membrane protein
MNFQFARALAASLSLALLVALTACVSDEGPKIRPPTPGATRGTTDTLRVGDKITIILTDIPGAPLQSEQIIPEDGDVTVHLDLKTKAAGKTKRQLADDIRNLYVPRYYTRMTVNVKTEERFVFVSGEVKLPNRYLYSGELTVLKVIATAGGFTDFANKKKVELSRLDGSIERIDCVKALADSSLDLAVYPGEKVFVPRRF